MATNAIVFDSIRSLFSLCFCFCLMIFLCLNTNRNQILVHSPVCVRALEKLERNVRSDETDNIFHLIYDSKQTFAIHHKMQLAMSQNMEKRLNDRRIRAHFTSRTYTEWLKRRRYK